MLRFRRTDDLGRPAQAGVIGVHFDPNAFGRFSEGIARFLGTGRFLAGQTVIVAAWIVLNVVAVRFRWDPYPFILPYLLVLHAGRLLGAVNPVESNRTAVRDRVQVERDFDDKRRRATGSGRAARRRAG